ncbi:MAG: DegT/DnrJ/EryC1/StrS family aminotransferase [Cyanophyceae cyanobacterium]
MDPSFVPLFDLTQQYQMLAPELLTQVEAVMASGRYVNGPFVQTFEEQLAVYLTGSNQSTPQVIGCNSGTDALFLALRALGIGAGDEVLTSAFSFFASAEVISQVGAKPVFVDIDPGTFNLDPALLTTHITERTRAIMPVHLYGQAVDMDAVMQVARAHNLAVIEDCAQAVGSCWHGQPVGTFGDLGCFSFYPTKNLGGIGDGGAICTHNPELVKTLRILKDHGQSGAYEHSMIGVNSRLDALQAVILSVKLRHLPEWTWRRRVLATSYQQLLSGIPDLVIPQGIPGGGSVWNQFTIRILGEPGRRDRVQAHLQTLGVSSRIYYPIPLHLQPVYQNLGYQAGDYPHSETCAHQVLSLPLFPELKRSQQEHVAAALHEAMDKTAIPQG